MKKTFTGLLTLMIVVVAHSQQGGLLPSEAIALMYKAVDDNPDAKRIENTRPYVDRVITEDLEPLEQFYLGEVYFWNFMPKESKAAFSKVLTENALIANAARQRIWIININGFGLYDEVEKDLMDYQKNIKADPIDRLGAFFGVNFMASKYKEGGDHKKVVEVIDRELSRLDYSGAYSSFLIPLRYFDSYKEVGKEKELKKKLSKIRDGLQAELDKRNQNVPEKDFDQTVYCSTVKNMHTAVTEKLGYEQLSEKYEIIIGRLDDFIENI